MNTLNKSFFSITVVVFFISLQSQAQTKLNWSNLTQDQYVDNLVECKTTLDELKWSYNLWPKENKKPKPSFAEVVDKEQIRQSVHETLKMQAVLADVFNFEITPSMLQNDMNRMARNTKDAKRLKQMFAVLDNDPETIAQCISRPYLVQKKFANQYNFHNSIHSAVRLRAQSDLENYKSNHKLDDISAISHTVIYKIKSEDEKLVPKELSQERVVELNKEEFTLKLKELKNDNLQELDTAFICTQILEQQIDSIKVQILNWKKIQQNIWLKMQIGKEYFPKLQKQNFSLPIITATNLSFNSNSVINDSWENQNFPDSRELHTAIWTGTEMIVWGGSDFGFDPFNTGFRYNPMSDSYLTTSTANAPSGRRRHTAIWTGTEMIIWGGRTSSGLTNTGSRYNPANDSWVATPTINAPSEREKYTAIWTGTEMIVWGGATNSGSTNTGSRYIPGAGWTAIPTTTNAPSIRNYHTAVWTGTEMIVWGGVNQSFTLNTGARYNPGNNNWVTITTTNAPTARYLHTAIWTGSEMIVWGGFGGFSTGSRYIPGSGWTDIPTTDAPSSRANHTAIWSGTEMIIWGGSFGSSKLNTGARYNLINNDWTATNPTNAPTGRQSHTAIWTGSEMIVWGGGDVSNNPLDSGSRYNPSNDGWTATPTSGAPSARNLNTTIWTGSEMIVWGGEDSDFLNTGSRYNPASDSWIDTPVSGAPTARSYHTAIWTGMEMIIWGGSDDSDDFLNTGSSYNPLMNNWADTPLTTGVPSPRTYHTAIWTGSEMIIWGGFTLFGLTDTGSRFIPGGGWTETSVPAFPSARQYHTAIWTGSEMIIWGGKTGLEIINSGLRYNPSMNTWTETPTANAPSARIEYSSIWTGTEMIIWGGRNSLGRENTGSRYNPVMNSWTATHSAGAVSGRSEHSAIWTGTEMIVWGGRIDSGLTKTGSRYNPVSGIWTATSTLGAPRGRTGHTAIFTGTEMIVFGGDLNSLGTYYTINTYDISGNLSGLNGDHVILQNNLGDDLTLTANGAFSFNTAIIEGNSYNVTVLTHPTTPAQICTVTNGSGNNTIADVTDINVSCLNIYDINVAVTGLDAGNSIELTTNGQTLNFTGDGGPTAFPMPFAQGTNYAVMLTNQPTSPNQTCSITGGNSGMDDGSGSISGSDVAISVTCITNQYNVNVQVTGLAGSNTLDFTNGGNTHQSTADETFTLSTLDDLSAYDVTFTSNLTSPVQTCTASSNASGNLAGNHVTVVVTCVTTKFDVNITVSGLAATNSISFSNAGTNISFNADGTQMIAHLDDLSPFDVTIMGNQPDTPNQVCSFSNANSGNIAGAAYEVMVECVTTKYAIGVTVMGLATGNEVVLQNNGADDLLINSNGILTNFMTTLADESNYAVSVLTPPTAPNQTCSITGGSNNDGTGVLAGNNVTDIVVTCSTNTYFVGGMTSGLLNGNPVTLNLGAENLAVDTSTFIFANPLADLTPYDVSVASEPTSPSQSCSLTNSNGTIAGDDINSVEVNCQTRSFSIGGTLTGLHLGGSITLQNNNGDDINLINNGSFSFATSLLDLSDYEVGISSQPTSPIQNCSVSNNTGTLSGADVIDVTVTCPFGDDLIFENGFE